MLDRNHPFLDAVAHSIGHQIGTDLPMWMHPLLHVILVWAPVALAAVATILVIRTLWRIARTPKRTKAKPRGSMPAGLDISVYRFVLRYSAREQALLVLLGLTALPVLYATLELPKLVINTALSTDGTTALKQFLTLSDTAYLFTLCALYLAAIVANGSLKFWLNLRKGRAGEHLLRRLRLTIYRRWRGGRGSSRRSEIIPLIAQEVEPVGGFAADAFALPIFQGGTFVTILVFMFVQDPVLGAAAMTLLPVQLLVIPRLQQKVNALARRRVAEIRGLGGELGGEISEDAKTREQIRLLSTRLRRIEGVRLELHRWKFLLKALNNFLTALTPFFFYSIGGYLVIEDRLSIGALVAVLAAYKDFSAPLKELFRYYQSAEDVRVRYGEILNFLSLRPAAGQGHAATPANPILKLAGAQT